jgi:hypothetical protein
MFDVEGSEWAANFKVLPNICLEGMKKNMIHLSYNRQLLG